MTKNANGLFWDLWGHLLGLKILPSRMVASMFHNIFLSFWKERPMVWESSVSCSLQPGILHCTDCFNGSVWCKGCGLPATCPYPPSPDLGMANVFIKSSLLEQGFVMYLGHNGHPASPEGCLG